jgi:hypothetical protein
MQPEPSIFLQAVMGVGLASAAGLRAFVPMLVAGVAARLHWVELGSGFDWLASWPALVLLGVAVLVEVVADKVPLVDHLVDVVHVVAKPVIGALVAAAVFVDLPATQALPLGAILGGGVAGFVHLAKAKARVVSTATTAGTANPLLSAVEDAAAFVTSAIAVLVPLLVLIALLALAVWILTAWRGGRRHEPDS